MDDVLEFLKCQVTKSSSFDPMDHVVEMTAQDFFDLSNEIHILNERIKELEAGDCRFHCRSRRKENE